MGRGKRQRWFGTLQASQPSPGGEDRVWWVVGGEVQREDGPAIEHADGRREWWLNSKRHREDGPAIEYADGTRESWLNGLALSESEHAAAVEELRMARRLEAAAAVI